MPKYDLTGLQNVKSIVSGEPCYLLGSLVTNQSALKFQITNVASNGTTAVLTGFVREGNAPLVGDLLSTQGLVNLTNITNVAISAVSINATTGIGTISVLNAQTVGSIADAGLGTAPVSEVGETLVNGASIAVTVPYQNPIQQNARTLRAVVKFSPNPTTLTSIFLQAALTNIDSEFFNIGTTAVASVAAGTLTGGNLEFPVDIGKFYRFFATGVVLAGSPPAGTVIAKLLA